VFGRDLKAAVPSIKGRHAGPRAARIPIYQGLALLTPTLQIPAKLRAGIREVPPDQSGNSGFFTDDALRAPNPIARDNTW
jgi:hypothetical protein